MLSLSNLKIVTAKDIEDNPEFFEKCLSSSARFDIARTVKSWAKGIDRDNTIVLKAGDGIIVLNKLEQYGYSKPQDKKIYTVKNVFVLRHSCVGVSSDLVDTVNTHVEGERSIVYTLDTESDTWHQFLGHSLVNDQRAYLAKKVIQ